MNTNIDTLMTCDAGIRDGAESALVADLQWAAHVHDHKVKVLPFFKDAKNFHGITLYRSPSNWSKTTSIAGKVLRFFEATDNPGWVSAIAAIHAWNDDRVSNGERETFSLTGIAAILFPPTAKTVKETTTVEADAETVAPADAGTPLIDVMCANVQHLTADELVRLAAVIADRQKLVIAA